MVGAYRWLAEHTEGVAPMTATDRELPAGDLLMLVNGSRTAARSGRTYESTDPFTLG